MGVGVTARASSIMHAHTTFAGDPRSTVAVSWYSEASNGFAVYYGVHTSGLAPAGPGEIMTNWSGYAHHAVLTNLMADTRYVYVIAGPAHSVTGGFRTAPSGAASYTFGVVGDVQGKEAESSAWRDAGRWLVSQDVAFAVLMGDLVDNGSSQTYWNAFYQSAPELMRSTVLMPVLGNHDYYGGVQHYLSQFRLPPDAAGYTVADGARSAGRWYALTYGGAHFAVLDTEMNDAALQVTQSLWLASLDVASSQWRMAFMHTPVYTSGRVASGVARDVWAPNYFYPRGAHMVFNGHSHQLECTLPVQRAPLHGADGGAGFAGAWNAAVLVSGQNGLSNVFYLEGNTPVRYAGYDAGSAAVKTFAHGSFDNNARMAHRALQPLAAGSNLWLGYFYRKNAGYYAANQGGFRLEDSSQASRYLQTATTTKTVDGTNFGAFAVGLGTTAAATPHLFVQSNQSVPTNTFFVLAKFTFSSTQACAYINVYEEPQALPETEPETWDAMVVRNEAWNLTLTTLRLLGESSSRDAWISGLRIGRTLDAVVPPAGTARRSTPLVSEPFALPPGAHGVVCYDAGGINYNGPPPGNRLTDYMQSGSYVPLATLVHVSPMTLVLETRFYKDFGAYREGDILGSVAIVPEGALPGALGATAFLWRRRYVRRHHRHTGERS